MQIHSNTNPTRCVYIYIYISVTGIHHWNLQIISNNSGFYIMRAARPSILHSHVNLCNKVASSIIQRGICTSWPGCAQQFTSVASDVCRSPLIAGILRRIVSYERQLSISGYLYHLSGKPSDGPLLWPILDAKSVQESLISLYHISYHKNIEICFEIKSINGVLFTISTSMYIYIYICKYIYIFM